MQVLGYVRVSTEEQAEDGVGLDAQREAITAEAQRRGWDLIAIVEDRGYSAKDLKRPGIQKALAQLEAGEADALVTAKVDRLSRSTLDFAGPDRAGAERRLGDRHPRLRGRHEHADGRGDGGRERRLRSA